MRVLVFDTETTGLPETKIINPDTLNLWPHIVQFSFLIYDSCLNEIVKTSDSIVKVKEGVVITEESIKFHGITNKIARRKGLKIQEILNEFFYCLRNVDVLVGHNISFDINMVKIELLRMIYSNATEIEKTTNKGALYFLTNFKNICCTCSLKESIELCNIIAFDKRGEPYLKYPKLIELHEKLFEITPNNLHNSFNDILITLRCFIKLKYNTDVNNNCVKFKKIAKIMHLF
jgi:DNA polymerase III epsilon subunit-like protein